MRASTLGPSLPGHLISERSHEKCKDCRAPGNNAREEVGYYHQHSKEPLPLLIQSSVDWDVSGMAAELSPL